MERKRFRMSARDKIICCGEYIIIISMISFLFYDSFVSFFLLFPMIIAYERRYENQLALKKREELEKGFLKALQSISTSLAAGLSPENAIIESVNDVERMYGKKEIIVEELRIIAGQIASGMRVEDALYDFADRCDIESVWDFALVFSIIRKNGGSYTKEISRCTQIINMSEQTKEEIKVLVRGKQYEQKIMSIVQLGIILYLRFSSGSFINNLYHNSLGIIVMSVCLAVYVLSVYIGEKICRVEL